MRTLVLVVAICLTACGGGLNLDSSLAGAWSGPVSVAIEGREPLAYTGRIKIEVHEQTATVSELCADGSGTVSFWGSGPRAGWVNNPKAVIECPPVDVGTCTAAGSGGVRMFYESGSIELHEGGLIARVAGTGNWCGTATEAHLSLTALRVP